MEKAANFADSSLVLFPLLIHYALPLETLWLSLGQYTHSSLDQSLYYAIIIGVVLIRQPLWSPNTWTPGLYGYYLFIILGAGALGQYYQSYIFVMDVAQLRGSLIPCTIGPAAAHSLLIREGIEANLTFRRHTIKAISILIQSLAFVLLMFYVTGFKILSLADWHAAWQKQFLLNTQIVSLGSRKVRDDWLNLVTLNATVSAIVPLLSSKCPWRWLYLRIERTMRLKTIFGLDRIGIEERAQGQSNDLISYKFSGNATSPTTTKEPYLLCINVSTFVLVITLLLNILKHFG